MIMLHRCSVKLRHDFDDTVTRLPSHEEFKLSDKAHNHLSFLQTLELFSPERLLKPHYTQFGCRTT